MSLSATAACTTWLSKFWSNPIKEVMHAESVKGIDAHAGSRRECFGEKRPPGECRAGGAFTRHPAQSALHGFENDRVGWGHRWLCPSRRSDAAASAPGIPGLPNGRGGLGGD